MQRALRLETIIAVRRFSLSAWAVSFGWALDQVYAQKDQLFLWMPIFFGIGIGLYFLLPFEPPLAMGLVFWFIALGLHVFMRNPYAYVSFAIFLIASGVMASSLRTASIHAPVLEKKINITDVMGRVVAIEPMEEGTGSRVVLSDLSVEGLARDQMPGKIRLRLRADEGVAVGQRVKVLASLTPPSAPIVPGGFDFRRYLYFQGIGAVGFIFKAPEILEPAPPRFAVVERLRGFVAGKIQRALEPEQASVALALIVGQKNALSEDDKQALRDAGLAHMLAISGLHVGLVAGTLFFLLRFALAGFPALALRYPIKKIAAVFAFLGAVFYMLLAGSTVPTQRAVLMIGIVFLAVLLDRSPISLRLVAFSALIVLVARPESLLSASFHMSFAAVACLVYFYDVTRDFWARQYRQMDWFRRIMLYFLGVCATTVIASVATAPFALYHFGQVSFIGSFANLIVMPIFTFLVMPFALFSTVLVMIGFEHWPLQIVGAGIDLMMEVAHWAADLPGAILRASFWNFWSFLLLICASLWIILWKGWGKFLAAVPFAASVYVLSLQTLPDILVSPSHKLFGIYADGQLSVSSRRSDKFVLENWEEYFGLEEGSAVSLPYKGEDDEHACGEEGCRFNIGGQKVSYIRSEYAQREECAWADVLVSVQPVDKGACSARVVVGKFDTWRGGGHALWVSAGGVTLRSVAQKTSGRPWSAYEKED